MVRICKVSITPPTSTIALADLQDRSFKTKIHLGMSRICPICLIDVA